MIVTLVLASTTAGLAFASVRCRQTGNAYFLFWRSPFGERADAMARSSFSKEALLAWRVSYCSLRPQ